MVMRPINAEGFDLNGHELAATKELPCDFCERSYEVQTPPWNSAISFSAGDGRSGLHVSAHIVICADHLRELADKAEDLAPEPWNQEDAKRLDEELLKRHT